MKNKSSCECYENFKITKKNYIFLLFKFMIYYQVFNISDSVLGYQNKIFQFFRVKFGNEFCKISNL